MAKSLSDFSHPQKVRILYKKILRLHKGLPEELRQLGDNYAKDEFKRHKNCNIQESNLFMTEWTKYAVSLSKQLGLKGKPREKLGNVLNKNIIQNLKDEQIIQLYELMKATKGENSE